MDPSLTISTDPQRPPQLTPFPNYSNSNLFVSGAVSAPIHPLFPGSVNPNPSNNYVFSSQPPPPQTQAALTPQHPSVNHRPYAEMICAAIAALNEPDGSSKLAISRYIERSFTGLPPAHGALLTHHLKTLKNSGTLALVKKSYKFAASPPPESVAVAAATAASGMEVPRSEIPPSNAVNHQIPLSSVTVTGSASQSQKRGRGRPPKAKPEAQQQQQQQQQQPVSAQANDSKPGLEQHQSPVTKPADEVQESVKRRPGRPRKDGSSPAVSASVIAGIMKRRGRPPGRRAAGRQRKPKSVSSSASVFPYVANGARRRGRPRRIDSASTIAPTGGEIVAVAPGIKRGRGRPPKIGGVISRLMKPKRGRGRPVGRPRKALLIAGAATTIGINDPSYVELKRKLDLFQEKAKDIVSVLKAGDTGDNQAVVAALQELEALIAMGTVEPPPAQAVEEVQPEEDAAAPHAMEEMQPEEDAAAPQAMEEAQPEETQGEEEVQERGDEHIPTEAEAMREALF